MNCPLLRQLTCAIAAIGAFGVTETKQLLALDTLRVGLNGNISWTGKKFGADVTPILPEYKVSRQFTEVGNVPGNLIDLSNLDDIASSVLVKTVVDVPSKLLPGQLALVNRMLMEAVVPLSGIAEIDTFSLGDLSTVFITFQAGEDLSEVEDRISEAVDAIDLEEVAGNSPLVLPVALSPDHVARGENVAWRALRWGGSITAPAIHDVPADELEATLLELIQPGGAEAAFERKGIKSALGSFIVLDLGSPIGINHIRFYPRNTIQSVPQFPFQNDFLRQFELLLHDGTNLVLDGTGQLVPQLQDYKLLLRNTENEEPVVDVLVEPPQFSRFVRLKAISSFPYEIDELEVLGEGFIANSRYLSHVYDLGNPATWGNITWRERFVRHKTTRDPVAGPEPATPIECIDENKFFDSLTEVTPDWGDCERIPSATRPSRHKCYRTVCRDRSTGELISTPGKNRGKPVSTEDTWHEESVFSEDSKILIRTRTGTDPTPILYKRKNVQKVGEDDLSTSLVNPDEQLSREEYLGLTPKLSNSPPFVWDKGEIGEDLENWSPWSTPYRGGELAGGTPILSPGPRRYIQFSIEFQNSAVEATKMLEQLSIEYVLPPIADALIAEIFPRKVDTFETIQFTYAVRVLMNTPGVKGFDTFEILTPTRVLGIDKIQVVDGMDDHSIIAEQFLDADVVLGSDDTPVAQLADGSIHALPYSVVSATGDTFAIEDVTDGSFTVKFPQISRLPTGGERLLKIFFRSRVLLYSTLFKGQAILSSQPGTVQRITPGNADLLGQGDLATASDIAVLSPSITQGSLIGSFTISSSAFTPNGDGINDVLAIEYDVLAVTREAKIDLQLFDLSGRIIRDLYDGEDLSGHYNQSIIPELAWDGTDVAGNLVSPGIYLLRISIKGDARENQEIKPVAVVY